MADLTFPSGGTVLRDVSYSLRAMLLRDLKILGHDEDAVIFDSPANVQEAGASNRVMVYLYQLRENPYLANQPGTIVKNIEKGTYDEEPTPLALDLLYMIVPYAKNPEMGLYLADRIKQSFYSQGALVGDLLQGNLKKTGNDKINLVRDDLTIEQTRNIWNGFPNRDYKFSLFYLLTPVFLPSLDAPASGALVGKGQPTVQLTMTLNQPAADVRRFQLTVANHTRYPFVVAGFESRAKLTFSTNTAVDDEVVPPKPLMVTAWRPESSDDKPEFEFQVLMLCGQNARDALIIKGQWEQQPQVKVILPAGFGLEPAQPKPVVSGLAAGVIFSVIDA